MQFFDDQYRDGTYHPDWKDALPQSLQPQTETLDQKSPVRTTSPRVLILHASVGTGHKRAAQAIGAAYKHYQAEHVRIVDVLDYTSKIFRIAYAQAWIELTSHAPQIWGYFYTQTNIDPDVAKLINNVRKLIESVGTNDLKDVLSAFRPDIIICTHFLPMELLVRLKRKDRLSQPIYCAITDHATHTFWTYTDIDGYFVGSEQTKRQLIERGVAAEKVRVTGIPVQPAIALPKDATAVRNKRGFPTDEPLITLFGGGIASERVRKIVEGMRQSGIKGTLVVIAGRNPTLIDALVDIEPEGDLRLRLMGFVTYVDDIIAASDLVITKAGGLIISEVLARGIPLVIFDPIPGHEEWNADFVVSNGAGVQLRMAQSVPATVAHLIHNPPLLGHMRTRAFAIARPHAAQDIATHMIADWRMTVE
jgi:processive 1,2-diacylglycerol beta-glucosyltransferase